MGSPYGREAAVSRRSTLPVVDGECNFFSSLHALGSTFRGDVIYSVRFARRWDCDGGGAGLLMHAIMPENERVIDYGRLRCARTREREFLPFVNKKKLRKERVSRVCVCVDEAVYV